MASLIDVMHGLGSVEKGIERLREDFRKVNKAERESRAGIHRRLDDHADHIAALRSDIEITGKARAIE